MTPSTATPKASKAPGTDRGRSGYQPPSHGPVPFLSLVRATVAIASRGGLAESIERGRLAGDEWRRTNPWDAWRRRRVVQVQAAKRPGRSRQEFLEFVRELRGLTNEELGQRLGRRGRRGR